MKLTEPQRELLKDVGAGKRAVAFEYKPAKRLVALGLCQWNNGNFGSTWLSLTEAGRSALAEEGET